MRTRAAILAASIWPAVAAAQQQPLSAIDWLSNSIEVPGIGAPELMPGSPPPETITVRPLDRPTPDNVGLQTPEASGLPAELWSASDAGSLAARLADLPAPDLSASQRLLHDMLTARAAPPKGSIDGTTFFLSRLDALLALAAFGPAREVMELAGNDQPEIFRRWFDVALLTGAEDLACRRMRSLPEITPTYPARVFCLARSGDWAAAALTLETARALDVVTAAERERLTRFLDEYAGGLALPPPVRPTPLDYLLYEAIGEPMQTRSLPLPFAHTDLRPHIGWKQQIAAAERLARAGAIDAETLFEVYGRRAPAASGEPWDRIGAWQALASAIQEGESDAIGAALPTFWREMSAAGLSAHAARWATPRLEDIELAGAARDIGAEIALLSGSVDRAPRQESQSLAWRIVSGEPLTDAGGDAEAQAVIDGLTNAAVPGPASDLLSEGRSGEALLLAIGLVEAGAAGNLDAVRDGLAIFRAAGLDAHVRRIAVEMLLTDPSA